MTERFEIRYECFLISPRYKNSSNIISKFNFINNLMNSIPTQIIIKLVNTSESGERERERERERELSEDIPRL